MEILMVKVVMVVVVVTAVARAYFECDYYIFVV